MNGKNRTARKKRLPWMLRIASLALVVAVASTVQGQSRAPQDNVNGRPASAGEVLVKFRQAATVADRQLVGGQVDADQDVEVGGGGVHRLHSRSLNATALVAFLSAHPAVEYAEPNYLVQSTVVPNDPQLAQLWGLQNPSWAGGDIRAESAWDVSTGSKANVIAVVDTGTDYTHEDLMANIWSAPSSFTVVIAGRSITCPADSHGFNAITNVCDPMDDNHHGTHASGTIGAVGNNGIGVTGVNRDGQHHGLEVPRFHRQRQHLERGQRH